MWFYLDGSPAPEVYVNPTFFWEVILGHYHSPLHWWANKSDPRREMYICDPPTVSVRLTGWDDYATIYFQHWLNEPEGVKIKHVIDFMLPKYLGMN